MKKLLFWIVLIVGTVVLLGSCAKKDDSTTATAAAGNVAGTGTTASGTITGNDNLTGTFHTSWYGKEPSGGCVDNSSAISAYSFPSETLSFKKEFIITGSSTFTQSQITYSDATCSTMTSYFNVMYKDVTIGSELTGLTAGSSPAKPTTATKISSVEDKYVFMANTTDTIAYFLTSFTQTVTSGTEKVLVEPSPVTKYGLIATGTVSGSTYLFTSRSFSTADNVTDWSSASSYWK